MSKKTKKSKKNNKLPMRKKYKIPLILISILIILCSGLLIYKHFFYKGDRKPTVVSSIVDSMEEYGYTLSDQDGKLFKEKYYELKDILTAEDIDYDKYSQTLSELFIIDLYTMSTKINKYDVGGYEYVYKNEQEMFKGKVMDTIYESLEDNSYGDRKQQLPQVKSLELEDSEETTYKIEDKKLHGTKYTYSISYEKDLGYDDYVEITTVKDDDKVYVVEFLPINE